MVPITDMPLPSAATRRAIWSIIGPRALLAIAFVTLVLPETAEFYISLSLRNRQPRQKISASYAMALMALAHAHLFKPTDRSGGAGAAAAE